MLKSAAFLLLLALPAHADQTFKVSLGGHQIGWLRYSGNESNARLSSLFNSTPLGVFDGSYEGESRKTARGVIYHGKSESSTKSREVEIRSNAAGQTTQVAIAPEKDRTGLSDPAAVPVNALDPVAGFGRLIAQTCPAAFHLYDGRRVIQVSTKTVTTTGAVTNCEIDYRVVQGKGHLSPFYIKKVAIKMVFDPAVAKQGPSLLTLRSGIFEVAFTRD